MVIGYRRWPVNFGEMRMTVQLNMSLCLLGYVHIFMNIELSFVE